MEEAEATPEDLLELGFTTQLTEVQAKYKGKLAQKLKEVHSEIKMPKNEGPQMETLKDLNLSGKLAQKLKGVPSLMK